MATKFFLIAAGLITAANGVFLYITGKRRKEVKAEFEAYMEQIRLKGYQKRRMCNFYCKYKAEAKSQEYLEHQCDSCPLANL